MPCGHLLGMGWPLGSRLWCLMCVCHFPMWYPGSGVVLDCIDSWSLPPFLLCYFMHALSQKTQSNNTMMKRNKGFWAHRQSELNKILSWTTVCQARDKHQAPTKHVLLCVNPLTISMHWNRDLFYSGSCLGQFICSWFNNVYNVFLAYIKSFFHNTYLLTVQITS